MEIFKYKFILLFTFGIVILRGQNIDRANDLYKNGAYAEAIPIYVAFLAKKTSNNAAKVKLANCYRILNQSDKAAPLFKEIVEDEKARPEDFLHYAETLMMLGKYEEAKVFFKKFNTLEPENERGLLLYNNIDKIKKLHPLFYDIVVFPFPQNSDEDDHAPTLMEDGIAFASDRASGFNLLKEKNPMTGHDYETVYFARQTGDTSFSEPSKLSAKLTEINRNTSNISITADGKYAYFCRNDNNPTHIGSYNMQLYSARVEGGRSFRKIEPLPFCTPENNYFYPAISPDGSRLFFSAVRADGLGGLDIYMTTKSKKGWSRPENLGPNVNTTENEGFPFATNDGKLYFCSKGHPSYGGYDIFVTQQDATTHEWQKPVNIGAPINSPYDDISICFSFDKQRGAFSSRRGGRGDDIFIFNILSDSICDKMVKDALIDTSKHADMSSVIPASNPAPSVLNATIKQEVKPSEEIKRVVVAVVDTSKQVNTPKVAASNKPIFTAVDTSKRALNSVVDTTEGGAIAAKKTYIEQMQALLDNDKMHLNKSFTIENIHFVSATDSIVSSQITAELDKLVEFLKKNRKLAVEIAVHTEGGIESDKLAKQVSNSRADAIVAYLKSQGIKEKRIAPHGLGRMRPLKDCSAGGCTPEEDLKNRRVELKIKKNIIHGMMNA